MSEEKLVPKLRFSGFDDEWKSYKIGDISKTYSGGTPSTSKREYYEGDIPFIKSGEINNEVTEQYITEEAINNSSAKRVQKGDLLLALYGATSGEVAISKIDGAINQAVLKIDNSMDNYFQYNYFLKYKEQITHKYLQGGQGNLSANIIKKLEFNFPELNEQQKISEFLLLIDKKIQLLERKHDEYQDFKKFLMQQIFTQKLRFAKFTDDWKNCKFKDLGTVKSGVGFSTKYQGHLDLEYNLYKVSDMNLKGNEKIMVKSNNTIDDFILNEMNAKLITEPSIIFAKVGEAIFLNRKRIANKPFLIDNNMMAFTPNDKVNIDFMYYLSTTINFGKYAQTGALPSYNASDINTIKCKIPSKEEQEKIANILSLSDEKIDFYNDQLEKTKEFKKGLLQQMFV